MKTDTQNLAIGICIVLFIGLAQSQLFADICTNEIGLTQPNQTTVWATNSKVQIKWTKAYNDSFTPFAISLFKYNETQANRIYDKAVKTIADPFENQNTQTEWVVPNEVPEGEKYYVRIKVSSKDGTYKSWHCSQYFKIVKGNPNSANPVSWMTAVVLSISFSLATIFV
ncbi:hypothetical protein BKA69DRAFT_897622 [Paraphysoderma sedebokerense]|nr:hypothetical protein BKA69DRAFT_897622 [Paraphysoderma sedebokerense]